MKVKLFTSMLQKLNNLIQCYKNYELERWIYKEVRLTSLSLLLYTSKTNVQIGYWTCRCFLMGQTAEKTSYTTK